MGNTNLNIRRRQRGNGDAQQELKRILCEEYETVKDAYQQLPSQEAKDSFLNLFKDQMDESEFFQGPWRVEMAIVEVCD